MHKLLLPIFFLVVVLLPGCGYHLYRVYDYAPVVVQLSHGSLYVEAIGEYRSISDKPPITELTGPYRFRIVFLTEDEPGQPIQINILNLAAISEQAEIVSVYPNLTQPDMSVRIPTLRFAAAGYVIVIASADTGHEPVTLNIELIYRGKSETITVNLVPGYEEEMRGGFGDLMRSV